MHDNRFDSLQTSPILVLALNGQAKIAYLWAEAFTDEVVALSAVAVVVAVDMALAASRQETIYLHVHRKSPLNFGQKKKNINTKLNKKNRTIKYVH